MPTQEVTKTGTIAQIVGVVVDVEFQRGQLPAINYALTVKNGDTNLTLEVAQHLSETSVRTIALSGTDGLQRGATVTNTGAPISVPVGEQTLGRMFNVTGEPIDGKPATTGTVSPIHREAPGLTDQSGKTEILETGIKVIDLRPNYERWQSRPYRWCRCGQNRAHPGTY
jgi:F0F1-type ATP synthase beta subunit